MMPELLEATYRPILEAVSFAARAHHGQLRKDGRTPYSSHVFRVCLIVRHVFGVDDPRALLAAALHDTLEDTTTDYDDLAEAFGKEVAEWVALLSKDSRQPEEKREALYRQELANAPWQVKVCKMADIFDNLLDSRQLPPEKQARTRRHSRIYLDALAQDLTEQARQPWQIVNQLLEELKSV
jgi:(p)ppGpp synthase/HD superfamily hydrolase